MRGFVFASAISGMLCAGVAHAAPARVVSLNLCTDELLLALAAPAQIASVTHLSHSSAEASWWRAARRHAANDGSLTSVAALKPGLVLTMGGGVRDRAGIASRLGLQMLDLPFPQTIGDVKASVTRLAAALGRKPAGQALNRRIDLLAATAPRRSADTIWLGGGGITLTANSLGAQWLRLAGLRQRNTGGDRVSLEQLVLRPPTVLVRSDYRAGQYSGAQRWLEHPLARDAGGRSRVTRTDGRAWTCLGPAMIGEIMRLRR